MAQKADFYEPVCRVLQDGRIGDGHVLAAALRPKAATTGSERVTE